jgi:hypothetical protein
VRALYALQAASSPLGPLGPSRVGVFAERRILFNFAHSGRDAFSLSRHCHVGPACQLHPFPHAGRLLPLLLVASGHPAPPSSTLRCRPRRYSPHHHFPPLIPLLTSPPSSMASKPLTPPLLPLATPLRRSPGPYKRAMGAPALTAPPHCTLSPLP